MTLLSNALGTGQVSGYSGFSGRSGFTGVTGVSGFSGRSGFSGSGISGFSGTSGYSGQPTPSVRQTVAYATTTSAGYNNMISAGAGLNYNITASPTNAVLTFANNTLDYTSTLTANASNQGSLVASTTNYLSADYSSSTAVTWGSYLVPPQYGYSFDQTQNSILNFEGTNGATTTTDDFGSAWTLTGATISTAQFKFGSSSLDCTGGTAKYAQSTAFTSLGNDSWEISYWFRINALPTSGNYSQLLRATNGSGYGIGIWLYNNAGTTRLSVYLSSTGSSYDIANAATGTNTTWTTGQWNKFRLVFDALGGTYKIYLSLNGAAESTDYTVSSTARICAFASLTLGRNTLGNTEQFDGWYDGFRLMRASSSNSAVTPSANAPAVSDFPVNYFNIPAMTMNEVTAASSTAGTNPTFTQKNRLFVGEADTGATTVSAVRNYALRGQYMSADVAIPSASTRTTFNHLLGSDTDTIQMNGWIKFVTNWNGYTAGMVIPYTSYYSGTNPPFFLPEVVESRNVGAILTQANNTRISTPETAPNTYDQLPSGSGTALLFVTAQRSF